MSAPHDAIVIRGGINGLVAATYLAKAGRSVLLLEAEAALGGSCRRVGRIGDVHASFGGYVLTALDPHLVKDLGLRALKYVARDLPINALRQDGRNLLLTRDVHAAARAIAAQSPADAETYKHMRSELFALARAMRPFWWDGARVPELRDASQSALFARLKTASAGSFLSSFESETLKAALAFDTVAPFEPGSALALAWRAAQEMCGQQGAAAIPQGGAAALADMLATAAQAAGVQIRTEARVAKLIAKDTVAGVVLNTGEEIPARTVLSSLSRRMTLLDLAPTASAGFAETQRLERAGALTGEASILFLLTAAPAFNVPNARFLIVDRLESYFAADRSARAKRLPEELLIEAVVPTIADPALAPGKHILSVRVPGLPLAPEGGWPALSTALVERVTAALERHASHLREHIIGLDLRLPHEEEPFCGERLAMSYEARIHTPIEGLFLCGMAAEPMNAISGRAGRLAAGIANAWLARKKLA
jgi:phytoene dehydrogenase-like protein